MTTPRSLVDAVLTRQAERMALELPEGPTCAVCGASLRSDNRLGICRPCQRAHLSARLCACGCGQHLDTRNAGRYVSACLRRLLGMSPSVGDIRLDSPGSAPSSARG